MTDRTAVSAVREEDGALSSGRRQASVTYDAERGGTLAYGRVVLRAAASVLTGESLREWTSVAYDLGPIDEIALWLPGMNDHYVVRAMKPAMLRLYRFGKRTDADVMYELDALEHLSRKNVPVAVPIRRRDGALLGHIDAFEGRRQAVLFAFAPGAEDFAREPDEARAYGMAVARIHAATDDFASAHERIALDVGHLVDRSLATVLPWLVGRPDDAAFAKRLAERLRRAMSDLVSQHLDYGFCHGDLYGANASKTPDGLLTFYDFDCCGPGWRAYDAAVFRWLAEMDQRAEYVWLPFLEGYRSVRALGEADLAAVPLFVVVRALWHLAQHIEYGPYWGFGWNVLSEHYLDQKMGFLRKLETAL